METIWQVYELYNLLGSIEYVGETMYPNRRFREHTKSKTGKFYGRTDISMNIVKEFDNPKEAWDYQCKLQKEYGLPTDGDILSKSIKGKTKGISKSVQHKLNMSANHADISGKNNPMYAKNHSTESKLKMSQARKLYWDNIKRQQPD
jgi:predicted GIY-YIG superfamily endonuclease